MCCWFLCRCWHPTARCCRATLIQRARRTDVKLRSLTDSGTQCRQWYSLSLESRQEGNGSLSSRLLVRWDHLNVLTLRYRECNKEHHIARFLKVQCRQEFGRETPPNFYNSEFRHGPKTTRTRIFAFDPMQNALHHIQDVPFYSYFSGIQQ